MPETETENRGKATNYYRYQNPNSELQSEGLISEAFDNADSTLFDEYSDLEFIIEVVKNHRYSGVELRVFTSQ